MLLGGVGWARRRSFVANGAPLDDGQMRASAKLNTSVTVTELAWARNTMDETFPPEQCLTSMKV
jgi:hypothetical protein